MSFKVGEVLIIAFDVEKIDFVYLSSLVTLADNESMALPGVGVFMDILVNMDIFLQLPVFHHKHAVGNL